MDTELIQATMDDVTEVYANMDEVRRLGIGDWDEEYPTLDIIEDDAREGNLYILREEGKIVASITVRQQEGDYDGDFFDGCGADWARAANPAIMSRLCVAAGCQGRGIGGRMALAGTKKAFELGFDAVRFLAAEANPVAVDLYRRRNFDERGRAYLFETWFRCFDATPETKLV